MLRGPAVSRDAHLVDRQAGDDVAACGDRDRQPVRAVGGLDPVAVAPAVLVVLHVVVEDEDVRLLDLVEVAAPGDIRRLEDARTSPRRPVRASSAIRSASVRSPSSRNSSGAHPRLTNPAARISGDRGRVSGVDREPQLVQAQGPSPHAQRQRRSRSGDAAAAVAALADVDRQPAPCPVARPAGRARRCRRARRRRGSRTGGSVSSSSARSIHASVRMEARRAPQPDPPGDARLGHPPRHRRGMLRRERDKLDGRGIQGTAIGSDCRTRELSLLTHSSFPSTAMRRSRAISASLSSGSSKPIWTFRRHLRQVELIFVNDDGTHGDRATRCARPARTSPSSR